MHKRRKKSEKTRRFHPSRGVPYHACVASISRRLCRHITNATRSISRLHSKHITTALPSYHERNAFHITLARQAYRDGFAVISRTRRVPYHACTASICPPAASGRGRRPDVPPRIIRRNVFFSQKENAPPQKHGGAFFSKYIVFCK